ncbi:MAG TPA: hypothetical protein VL354_14740, partial [Spirochaetia bacterium]|nr:hypothetical protein [Spirochaetia bacterium]
KNKVLFDVFVLSGFISSFFYGFLNPLYVSVILAHLDPRVIAVGSFMSSGFPVLIGAVLGNPRLFKRIYAVLPWLMMVELGMGVATALVAALDLALYYLASMVIMGVFSTSVVYLLQKVKEKRYRTSRANFDRRYGMADALGSGAGSVLSIVAVSVLKDPVSIAAVGVLQTAVVYGLFLIMYRRIPSMRKHRADEEPHPWMDIQIVEPTFAAA